MTTTNDPCRGVGRAMGRKRRDPQLALESGAGEVPLEIGAAATSAMEADVLAKGKSWKWLLVGINVCGLLGGVAAAAFLWMLAVPPEPECHNLKTFSADIERLYCAETAARSGDLTEILAGIDLLSRWSPDRPLYRDAQRLIDTWSDQLLQTAKQTMIAGDFAAARRLIGQIPLNSPVYAEAQDSVAQWQSTWDLGGAIATQVETALVAQNWAEASAQVQRLQNIPHDFWRLQQFRALSQRVWQERQARKLLPEALKQAQKGDRAQALTLVSQMQANTYARREIQPLADQWGLDLLDQGRERWRMGDFAGAIALATQVRSSSSTLTAEADALETLVAARRHAILTATRWTVSAQDIYTLEEAIAQIQRIPQHSRFYPQAQDSRLSWQQQVEDLRTLQMAQLFAQIGATETYRVAIAQAETIAPDHLRRQQAQTLVAHWQQELEQLEDTPTLAQARALAADGSRGALRAAIAQASRIALGRALRSEAQAYVYQWNAAIQRMEDEPFLVLAQAQAQRGNWQDAIRAAEVIRPGRVLYPTAQTTIAGWRDRILQAEARRRTQEAPPRAVPNPRMEERSPVATQPASRRRSVPPAISPVASPNAAATSSIEAVSQEVVQPLYAPLQVDPLPSSPEPTVPVTPVQEGAIAPS